MGKKIEQRSSEQDYVITVNGIRTHIVEAGTGPSLVLVHGLGGPLMWQKVIEPLSKTSRVIVIDLPGWGDSNGPDEMFTTTQYADFLIQCFDALSIHKAALMGISYGGQIAAVATQRFPSRIHKLILIASTGLERRHLLNNNFIWLICSMFINVVVLHSEWLMCLLARRSFFDIRTRPLDLCSKFYQQISHRGKRDAWLNAIRNIYTEGDFSERLSEIKIPTLIIWGEGDKTVFPSSGEKIHRQIPNSQLTMFSQCAHSVPLEKPDDLCKWVVSFLQ